MVRLARAFLVIGGATMLSSCHSWQRTPTVREGVAKANLREIRVRRFDGVTVYLFNASIVGDSLIGHSTVTQSRVAIATSNVASVESKGISAGRTALATTGIVIVVAVAGLALLLSLASGGGY